jgi:hypothetical protein
MVTCLNLSCRGDGKAQKSKEEDEESIQVCFWPTASLSMVVLWMICSHSLGTTNT